MSRILALIIVFLVSCQSQEPYAYENIKSEIESYLTYPSFNNFTKSDTLMIYDTTYFNNMITALSKYQDKLILEDSMYNRQITEQLTLFNIEKIQTLQPDIYLPFQAIKANLNEENLGKIMVWLTNVPKQFEAAKTQLAKPNLGHTQQAVEELKSAYIFIANDLTRYMEKSSSVDNYEAVLDETKFAIKDYLAFLNSKIINKEVK